MTTTHARAGVLFAAAAAIASAGCNYLVDSNGYRVVIGDGGGSALEASSADAAGDGVDGDVSLDGCPAATNRLTLENGCTHADCVPFVGSVPLCDGGLCPLPSQTLDAATVDAAEDPRADDDGDTAVDGTTDGATTADATVAGGDGDASSLADGASLADASSLADGASLADASSAGGDASLADASSLADGASLADASSAGGDAGALAACATLRPDTDQIVFVTGSTALASFIGEVSKVLATQPTDPVTVVYQQSGSCVGVRAAIDPTNNPLLPSLGTATYYDALGNQHPCALDPAGGTIADVGASDVFYSTCYLGQPITPSLPQSVSENYGPVQVMNFAVPQGSPERSISLKAAYYVFGFGGAGGYGIPPWTDPTQLQIRSAASGTQSMIGAAIGVPPSLWKGVANSTSAGVGNALVAAGQSGSPDRIASALGILASDYLIQNMQTLRGLAVQDENAGCGYYPGSTATARDDANVRNGHYPLWGPSHFYARVDPQRQLPLKQGVSQFIDGLSGVTALPGLDLVGEYAAKGLIPLCAMGVSRSDDGGDYTPSKPPITCNCYFDLIATGQTSCMKCDTDSDCPSAAPACNKFGPAPQQGYCDL